MFKILDLRQKSTISDNGKYVQHVMILQTLSDHFQGEGHTESYAIKRPESELKVNGGAVQYVKTVSKKDQIPYSSEFSAGMINRPSDIYMFVFKTTKTPQIEFEVKAAVPHDDKKAMEYRSYYDNWLYGQCFGKYVLAELQKQFPNAAIVVAPQIEVADKSCLVGFRGDSITEPFLKNPMGLSAKADVLIVSTASIDVERVLKTTYQIEKQIVDVSKSEATAAVDCRIYEVPIKLIDNGSIKSSITTI